jgi:hypothetical protein
MFELLARTIPTTYSDKHAKLIDKKSQIEILVLGSSHSNYGINPQFFGRESFNISNNNQGFFQDYQVVMRYLPECKNLKMVIIPISYFSLQYDLGVSHESWRCPYYSFYMGVHGAALESVFELNNYSALILWDGPFEVLRDVRKVKKMDINEYGYQYPVKNNVSINDAISDSAGKQRVAVHYEMMNDKLLHYNIEILNKMAEELGKRKIKIVFVTTPVYRTYSKYISKNTYELMVTAIEDLSEQHSASYFNYFYDSRFELSDFMDNDHLNAEGAKKFSIILKNEIIDRLM